MFSKACEDAIRAMVLIVLRTQDGSRVGIKEIANHTGVPEPFIAKILQTLTRKKILCSLKGPHGGFYIGQKKPLPLITIVKAIDGTDMFTSCGLGIENCSAKRPCPLHYELKQIRESIKQMLHTNTIQDLAAGLVVGETFLFKDDRSAVRR